MKTIITRWIVIAAAAAVCFAAQAQNPKKILWWSFDDPGGAAAVEQISKQPAAITGRFSSVPGVLGQALKLDGYTTEITLPAAAAPKPGANMTFESWVAQGAYPWNWCPIISQCRDREAGYELAVGPAGQVRFRLAVGENWMTCVSPDFALPLRAWSHVAATFAPDDGLRIYVDGRPVGYTISRGQPKWAGDVELRIGSNHTLVKPSNIHREYGTVPVYFSLDGILDELQVWDRTLSPSEIARSFQSRPAKLEPDLPQRRMPAGPEGPGRFGAYYTNLKYYPEWDALWRVDADPDVLVRFDRSPVRVVFWRGTRYSPAWVIDDKWMADQSSEAWTGSKGPNAEGCFEHMQDRHCKYSHVRIIESNPARVVVHWRYAPVSAHDNLWNVDPKTGQACWMDEYYTIYPDALGIRKVSWTTGTFAPPNQFQESLPFTQEGQKIADVVERDFATLSNMNGETVTVSFVEKPAKEKPGVPKDIVVQVFNFKSPHKPSIIHEPGAKMIGIRDYDISRWLRPGGANHWPVGQMACDGRTSLATDRPTHFQSLPLADPVLHDANGRTWWNSLYGMTKLTIAQLSVVARSWNAPALLAVGTEGFISEGYDKGQRAYVLERIKAAADAALKLRLPGSEASPVFHPVFVVKNWGSESAKIKIAGRERSNVDIRVGFRNNLETNDLVVWCDLESTAGVEIEIVPGK
jgi:hypothetical protein